MATGASDGVFTNAAGIPTYGVSGIAIEIGDVRAHGRDERVGVTSYYDGVEFYYRYVKALTLRNDSPTENYEIMRSMRSAILAASQNAWLREHAPRFRSCAAPAARFLPGEDAGGCHRRCARLAAKASSGATHLGENIADRAEAEEVTRHIWSSTIASAPRACRRKFR